MKLRTDTGWRTANACGQQSTTNRKAVCAAWAVSWDSMSTPSPLEDMNATPVEIDDDTVRPLVDFRGEERDQLLGGGDVDLP